MHDAAMSYVAATVAAYGIDGDVLDIGGRDVNGTPRHLFNGHRYIVVDLEPGSNVNLVADAAALQLPARFDVVVSTEVFEHTARAGELVATAHRHLKPGGVFIATMAGIGRAPHSAFDGGPLRAGEFYRNVGYDDLAEWLEAAGFARFDIDETVGDIRCTAWKGVT